MADAPYKQSRAALRRIYGARSIDASAPQSARDQTPSGRLRYIEQTNPDLTADEAKFFRGAEFHAPFRPRPSGFERPQDMAPDPLAGVTPVGTNDLVRDKIAKDYRFGSTSRNYDTPYGKVGFETEVPTTAATPLSFNLSEPSTLPASVLSPYAPRTDSTAAYTPPWRKKPNQGYMGSILGGPSKWLA